MPILPLSIITAVVLGFLTFLCGRIYFKEKKKSFSMMIATIICLVSFLLCAACVVYTVMPEKNDAGFEAYHEKGTVNLEFFLDSNGTIHPLRQ